MNEKHRGPSRQFEYNLFGMEERKRCWKENAKMDITTAVLLGNICFWYFCGIPFECYSNKLQKTYDIWKLWNHTNEANEKESFEHNQNGMRKDMREKLVHAEQSC